MAEVGSETSLTNAAAAAADTNNQPSQEPQPPRDNQHSNETPREITEPFKQEQESSKQQRSRASKALEKFNMRFATAILGLLICAGMWSYSSKDTIGTSRSRQGNLLEDVSPRENEENEGGEVLIATESDALTTAFAEALSNTSDVSTTSEVLIPVHAPPEQVKEIIIPPSVEDRFLQEVRQSFEMIVSGELKIDQYRMLQHNIGARIAQSQMYDKDFSTQHILEELNSLSSVHVDLTALPPSLLSNEEIFMTLLAEIKDLTNLQQDSPDTKLGQKELIEWYISTYEKSLSDEQFVEYVNTRRSVELSSIGVDIYAIENDTAPQRLLPSQEKVEQILEVLSRTELPTDMNKLFIVNVWEDYVDAQAESRTSHSFYMYELVKSDSAWSLASLKPFTVTKSSKENQNAFADIDSLITILNVNQNGHIFDPYYEPGAPIEVYANSMDAPSRQPARFNLPVTSKDNGNLLVILNNAKPEIVGEALHNININDNPRTLQENLRGTFISEFFEHPNYSKFQTSSERDTLVVSTDHSQQPAAESQTPNTGQDQIVSESEVSGVQNKSITMSRSFYENLYDFTDGVPLPVDITTLEQYPIISDAIREALLEKLEYKTEVGSLTAQGELIQHLMLAVAYKESRFNFEAVSKTFDYGVFQLNLSSDASQEEINQAKEVTSAAKKAVNIFLGFLDASDHDYAAALAKYNGGYSPGAISWLYAAHVMHWTSLIYHDAAYLLMPLEVTPSFRVNYNSDSIYMLAESTELLHLPTHSKNDQYNRLTSEIDASSQLKTVRDLIDAFLSDNPVVASPLLGPIEVSQEFGIKNVILYGSETSGVNQGVDIPAQLGDEVYLPVEMELVAVGPHEVNYFGNQIALFRSARSITVDGEALYLWYFAGHVTPDEGLQNKIGQKVLAGTSIGKVNMEGNTTGPHFTNELRVGKVGAFRVDEDGTIQYKSSEGMPVDIAQLLRGYIIESTYITSSQPS